MTEKPLFNSGGGRIENKKIYTQERKKTMKKVTSLLLALVMALALAVPAFAVELTDKEVSGNRTQDVTANVTVTDDQKVNTYFVKVEWNQPSFSYIFKGTKYTWDTTNLKYKTEDIGKDGWESNTSALSLKVTNSSDMPVNCTATLVPNTEVHKNLTMTCWDNSNTVTKTADAVITIGAGETAADYTGDDASRKPKECDLSGTITVGGEPNKTKGATTLGTITLTLTK